MIIKYLTIAFLAIVFSLPLSAQQCNNKNEDKLMLFYANGMLNTYKEAKRSLDYSCLELLRQEKIKNIDVDYEVLENISELKDSNDTDELLEVAAQYVGYQIDFKVNEFKNWYKSKIIDISEEKESEFIKILDRFYSTVSYDRDLERHLLQYENAFNNGYKVMTIAHSQGNLYTEKAYKSYLQGAYVHGEDYTILSVGTPIELLEKEMMLRDIKDPVALLSDNFPFPGDKVKIDNKEIPELVVDSNLIIATHMPYHNYLTYLYGSSSRGEIQDYFSSSIDKLFQDEDLCGEDLFVSVELTSDTDNVELVISEHIIGMEDNQGLINTWSSLLISEDGVKEQPFTKETQAFSKYGNGKYLIKSSNLNTIIQRQNGFIVDTLGISVYALVKEPKLDENGEEVLPNITVKIKTPLDRYGGYGLEFDILNYNGGDSTSLGGTRVAHINVRANLEEEYNFDKDRNEYVLKGYGIESLRTKH
tara:strand:- start:3909 stop:5333 length:1425 start_codon:yes stop_codon:yes gene_type:complete